jgi:hypothetical protein
LEVDVAQRVVILSFPGATADLASRYARSLKDELAFHHIESSQAKPWRSDSQDFGVTLAVILGTTAVTTVARGIEAWLKRNSVQMSMSTSDGEVVVKDVNSEDAARIAEALVAVRKRKDGVGKAKSARRKSSAGRKQGTS